MGHFRILGDCRWTAWVAFRRHYDGRGRDIGQAAFASDLRRRRLAHRSVGNPPMALSAQHPDTKADR